MASFDMEQSEGERIVQIPQGNEPGSADAGGPLPGQTNISNPSDRPLVDERATHLVQCKMDCEMCWRQFLQGTCQQFISYEVNDEEARARIDNLLHAINQDRKSLIQHKMRHGTTLINRLLKRRKGDLGDILRRFDPRLTEGVWQQAEKHEELIKKQSDVVSLLQALANEDVSTPWLMSYAYGNRLVEQPLKIVALIDARISNPPEDWIPFDFNQTNQLCRLKLLKASLNKNCVVVRCEGFGNIVPWDANDIHDGEIMAYPMAEIVLTLQARIFALLTHIVSEVMDGSTSDGGNGCAKWDKFVKQDLRRDAQLAHWNEFSGRPFSTPLNFDIDRLVELAKAQLEDATDMLWGMQTDLTYFQWTIQSYLGAKYSRMYDGDQVYELVYDAVVEGAMHTAMTWKWVFEECLNMQKLVLKYQQYEPFQRRTSEEYRKGVQSLKRVVEGAWQHFYHHHGPDLLLRMPKFEDHYKIQRVDVEGKIWLETNIEGFSTKNPLLWVLFNIFPGTGVAHVDSSWIFANIDEILYRPKQVDTRTSGPKALNAQLLRVISDLAAVLDMLRTLQCAMPDSFEAELGELAEDNQARHFWRVWGKGKSGESNVSLEPLVNAMRKIEAFPLPKGSPGLTHEYINQWLKADTLSRDFWKQARIYRSSKLLFQGYGEQDRQPFIDLYSYDLQQEHIDARDRELERLQRLVLSKTEIRLPHFTNNIELQDWQKLGNEGRIHSEFTLAKEKQKVKTHRNVPDDAVGSERSQNEQSLNVTAELKAKHIVKRKSFEIFMCMFPISTKDCSMVHWDDFLYAMADAGFSIKARGGSAYGFTQNNGGTRGSINEHRPHPSAEMSPKEMRAFGRRLQKHFGIDRDSFECKD